MDRDIRLRLDLFQHLAQPPHDPGERLPRKDAAKDDGDPGSPLAARKARFKASSSSEALTNRISCLALGMASGRLCGSCPSAIASA
ncbi:MAG: hypothetical protein R3F54_30845 [Alphaproteobacteria bacterium]